MKQGAEEIGADDPPAGAREKSRFSRILVPADSKETAELMVPLAKKLLSKDGEIITLNVIDTTFPLEVIDKWKKSTRISIAAVEAGYRHEVNVTPEVKNAKSVVGCIAEEVYLRKIDLLMFVVNPREGRKSFRFGSKTRNLARNAPCNVMMLNELMLVMPGKPGGKILAAIKSDREGRELLLIAKTLSEELGGLPIIQYRMPDGSGKRKAPATGSGLGEYRTFAKVHHGARVADAILNELSKEKYSVVLLSSNISRASLPFYSDGAFEHLMRNAPCPVMIYRKFTF